LPGDWGAFIVGNTHGHRAMKKLEGRLLAACMSAVFFLGGCSTVKETAGDIKKSVVEFFYGSSENLTAQELAWKGMDAYDEGNYEKSIEHFQRLKDIYPFSKYAMLAELKLGDANYRMEKYEDAVFAYEEFEKLHPRNEAVPYVIYQIGRCHFDRINTTDRDQTAARKALDAFQRLQKQYPGSPYALSAADHIVACFKSLSGHDYSVGMFYFKTKHYKGALGRFTNVVTKYPDVGYHRAALDYIARCKRNIEKEKTAEDEEGLFPSPESVEMMPEG
jgi:outer membrane protein assembly factor BamD